MGPPRDPAAAAAHPGAYDLYAELLARRPFYRDDAFWVASSADAVTAVLTSDAFRVRPAAEPVPAALAQGPVGELYRQMIRMNDGAHHRAWRPVVAGALGLELPGAAAECADALAAGLSAASAPSLVTDYCFQLPVQVVARLLGVRAEDRPALTAWSRDLARCIAPGATAAQVERGGAACLQLTALLSAAVDGAGLLGAMHRAAAAAGLTDPAPVVANAAAFFFQLYDATAGLLGNTLLALAAHPTAAIQEAVLETLRWNAPIQSTRRFAARDAVLAGQEVRAGEAVLVLLAAANRDPAANPDPDRFDPLREDPRVFSFGAGVHACPGRALAVASATAGVRQLLQRGVEPRRLALDSSWMPSLNARVPLFGGPSRYQ